MKSLSFRIAWRFLKSSRGQTIMILLGIMIGVSVQIFIGSLIDGLQKSLVDNTIGRSSQITVVPSDNENDFTVEAALLDSLNSNSKVSRLAVSFTGSAFLINADDSWPLLLRGFEMEDADEIYRFEEALQEGRLPVSEREAILGSELAAEAGLSTGDKFIVRTAGGTDTEIQMVGIFDLQVSSINQSWVITSLETSQSVFDRSGRYTSIEMQTDDVFAADETASELSSLLAEGQEITNWKDQNASLLSALSGQSASSYMIQVFVLLAVLLGISSVLAISVVQKSRQLGILKAMGIKDRDASRIFIAQGLILGVVGAILGTGLGLGLSYAFSTFVKNPDGTSLVPFFVDWMFIGFSVVIAIAAATIAAFIPARKSSRLNPIEVIKNG
jgi:lipoprotein-releasing system permease protein